MCGTDVQRDNRSVVKSALVSLSVSREPKPMVISESFRKNLVNDGGCLNARNSSVSSKKIAIILP